MINYRLIINLFGILLIIIGILMFSATPFSVYYDSGDLFALTGSGMFTLLCGIALRFYKGKNSSNALGKKEGYIIVSFGWVIMSMFGCLPYLLSGAITNPADSFFETVSGFTTTGASILNDIEELPEGILFWRSMTQWIGGMGIIVMAIAILPILGIGGMELFDAESSGSTEKIHPRIKETAKRLWGIYVLLTCALTGLLMYGGMSFYDAINHSLTTMATGGFSTKQDSIAYFNSPFIDYSIILFMFLAGTNFALMYYGLKGKLRRVWQNEEFMTYLKICLVLALGVGSLLIISNPGNIEKNFRDALFQVVSTITTTGFVTKDYTIWGPFIAIMFFLMMFIGASAGSTSGSIKIIRHLALAKSCFLEFKRILHPRAVIPVKMNGKIVAAGSINNILVFVLLYVMIFIIGSLIMLSLGLNFETSIGSVATTLGNVGPGLGSTGPSGTFYHIPGMAKWVLSLLMIIGRLELFTVLVLFSPYFWKSK